MTTINTDLRLVDAKVAIDGVSFEDITVKEVLMGESLLTPGLQTSVKLQSFIYTKTSKNFDTYRNKNISINMSTKSGKKALVNQKIYRIDNRSFVPSNVGNIEEFTVHACDQTLLNDAKSLVSRSWRCKDPSSLVKDVLGMPCLNARVGQIDSSSPSRDYVAENIHPFQVISQQANMALNGDSPDFVHFMTYDFNGGPGFHNFRSLRNMAAVSPGDLRTFYHYEAALPYNMNDNGAIAFSFPCDFDILTDCLNGLDENGREINTLGTFNPFNSLFKQLPDNFGSSCYQGGNYKLSMTNKGSTGRGDGACETDVERHLLRRQARMQLLEKDKVAMRLIAPWRPDIHAGDTLKLKWKNKSNNGDVYGTGDYLVSSLIHNIQFGGLSTTTFDCVSSTVGRGMV